MERLFGHIIPQGWGPQPFDDQEATWMEKAWSEGDIYKPDQIEMGHPVVCASGKHTEYKGGHFKYTPTWRGRLYAQCWCGRTHGEVTREMIRRGETHVCKYYRCQQIAGMSLKERIKFRPAKSSARGPIP